ncbi:MAG: clostripain-related cysteine peptidase [Thermoplasmata archaeon]|nr:clostripain-related cysteine peptidase [Thermoplasmata archaeon]
MNRSLQSVLVVGIMIVAAFSAVSIAASAKPTLFFEKLMETDDKAVETESPTWTVIVHLCGDNNLESWALADLEEMEKIGSKNGVNILVLMDTMTYFEGTHWYYIEPGSDHIDLENGVNDCDCEDIVGACPGELNMASGSVLQYTVKTAVEKYPADKYMVVLWNHGGGWKGVCYDDTTPLINDVYTDRLSTNETADALAAVETEITTTGIDADYELTMLSYDACLNGMIEVVYENRNVAKYMTASITLIPVQGYAYDKVLENLTMLPRLSDVEFGKKIVDTYVEYYSMCAGNGIEYYGDAQLSLFDLSKAGALGDAVDALATELLEGDYAITGEYRGAIESAESQTPKIEVQGEHLPFIDLGSFANLLGEKIPELVALTDAVEAGVSSTVVYTSNVESTYGGIMRTTGITIYFTCCWNWLNDFYPLETEQQLIDAGVLNVYGNMDLVLDTNWDEFVYIFSQVYVYTE